MVHVILLMSFLLSCINIKSKKGKSIELLICFTILFIFAALRYEYGNDFAAYHKIFVGAKQGVNQGGVEELYYQINRIIPSFQLLIALLSLLYLFVAYKLISENVGVGYRVVSVFIFVINPYLFLMSLSSLRQTFALCLFILALQIKNLKIVFRLIIYFLIIAVAYFIHQSALFLLPFFFVFNMKKNSKVDIIVFTVVPIVALLAGDLLIGLIEKIIKLFTDNPNYLAYITNNTPNSLRSTLLFMVIYIYVLMNLHKLEGRSYSYAKLYLVGLLFALLCYKLNMLSRFQMYFDVFGIVALPSILAVSRKAQKGSVQYLINAIVFPTIIGLIFVLRYFSFFTNDLWSYFFHYKTFIFK